MIFRVFDPLQFTLWIKCCFYHAMPCNAKRSLAVACRLSVCPSVTLVDHNHTHTHTHNRFTALLEYVRDHPGEQVPER